MANSIRFNLNQIRHAISEFVSTSIDIYKFYFIQTEQKSSLSPRMQQVKARQGTTTVRPEFSVDYDEERDHKVEITYSLWPGYTMEINVCGHVQPIGLDEATALADEIKAALEEVERHKALIADYEDDVDTEKGAL